MKARSTVLPILAVAAPGLVLATRVPAAGLAALAATCAAVLLAGLAIASAFRPRWAWAPPLALAAGIALLAIPASRESLVALPTALVALPVLALFHWLYPLDAADATPVGPQRGAGLHAVMRMAPLAAMLLLIALLPWLAGVLLPDRLASARELRGPLVALATALVLAALLALAILARAATAMLRRRRAAAAADAPASQEVA